MNNEKQYRFRVEEDGKTISGREIDDPFVHTHIEFHLSRWDAFKAVFKPLVKRYGVIVSGEDAAYRVVFEGDYTPPVREPRIQSEADGMAIISPSRSGVGGAYD